MSDRLTVDTINSDQLDALYDRLREAEAGAEVADDITAELRVRLEDAEAGITTAIRQRKIAEDVAARTKELLARRTETLRKRAERAEAAIARVRAHVEQAAATTAAGLTDYDISRHELACAVLTALDEPGPEETDTCRPLDVDGETILVRGSGEFTGHEQEFAAEIVRAAKRKYAAEHPTLMAATDQPVPPAAGPSWCGSRAAHDAHDWLDYATPKHCPGHDPSETALDEPKEHSQEHGTADD